MRLEFRSCGAGPTRTHWNALERPAAGSLAGGANGASSRLWLRRARQALRRCRVQRTAMPASFPLSRFLSPVPQILRRPRFWHKRRFASSRVRLRGARSAADLLISDGVAMRSKIARGTRILGGRTTSFGNPLSFAASPAAGRNTVEARKIQSRAGVFTPKRTKC